MDFMKHNGAEKETLFGNDCFLMTQAFSKKGAGRSKEPPLSFSLLTSYNTMFKILLFNSQLSAKGHKPI